MKRTSGGGRPGETSAEGRESVDAPGWCREPVNAPPSGREPVDATPSGREPVDATPSGREPVNAPPSGHGRAEAPRIRVVAFFGPYLRSAKEFLLSLEAHPEIELAGAFCEGEPESLGARLRDLWRRRGILAPAYLAAVAGASALRWVTRPAAEVGFRRALTRLTGRVRYVPDLHAPEILAAVRALAPDVGAIYGGPIVRPELFGIPRLGTLGVHHGRLPEYRGKKTTFWEMYCGEPEAGVTIQLVNEGIDTGAVVARGVVPTRGRAYRSVWRDVQREGIRLFVEAIVAVGRGEVGSAPAPGTRGPLRGDPRPTDILGLWWRQLTGRRA